MEECVYGGVCIWRSVYREECVYGGVYIGRSVCREMHRKESIGSVHHILFEIE